MTIDQANTLLAIASNKQQRLAALNALAEAARQAAAQINDDESDHYQLITRLVEARNVLLMSTDFINDWGQATHPAVDELDQAMSHITKAIEAL